MNRDTERWRSIWGRVLGAGRRVSKRPIMRETGMHWRTLEKILQHGIPRDAAAQGRRQEVFVSLAHRSASRHTFAPPFTASTQLLLHPLPRYRPTSNR